MSEENGEEVVFVETKENLYTDDDDEGDEPELTPRTATEMAALANHGLSSSSVPRSPKLVSRTNGSAPEAYGSASRVDPTHVVAQQLATENEVLGKLDREIVRWFQEKVSEQEAEELAQLHRKLGPLRETPQELDERLETLRARLYDSNWTTASEVVLPLSGYMNFSWSRKNKEAILQLNATVTMEGVQRDRERNHVIEATHPKLATGEPAINGLPCTHQAVFINLDFLAGKGWTSLTVEGCTSEEKIRFPQGMCLIPTLTEQLDAELNASDNMKLVFRNVFITVDFLRQLSRLKMVRTLRFERCAFLGCGAIENMDWLTNLHIDGFMINKLHFLEIRYFTLPLLKEVVMNARHRIITKEYRPVPTSDQTGNMPMLKVEYGSLNQFRLVGPVTGGRPAHHKLRRLTLGFFFQDTKVLVSPNGASNPWFSAFRPKTLKLITNLREEDPSIFFLEDSFDVNASPYNLALAEQALTHRFSVSTQNVVPQLMTSQMEGMRYKVNTILTLGEAFRIWTALLHVGPKVLSANVYFWIMMGIVPPYRELAKVNSTDETSESDKKIEEVIRDNYQITMRQSSYLSDSVTNVKIPLGQTMRRIMLVMGGNNVTRLPIIVMQISPFMDSNLWIPDMTVAALYKGVFEHRSLETLMADPKAASRGGDHKLPEGTKRQNKATLRLEDLVSEVDKRMPYSSPDLAKGVGFPQTYLVFWQPLSSGCYPDGFELVKGSADLQETSSQMRKCAKLMEIHDLPVRNGSSSEGTCGASFSLNPFKWFGSGGSKKE